ncbi:hypothetical protein [ANMV-1 virus]|nr:hypothetical protein [ANMV-1 virus]
MEPERSTPMPSIPLLNRLGLARRGRGEERAGPTMPAQAQEPQKVPLLIKAARHFKSLLVQTEPERPETIPTIPELNYPALYTRYPVMKTVTKTTDALGEMSVTYSHSFATIPGVVITVKDPDNVFGTVFSTTLTGFEARMFKIDHDHGGTVDDGGLHTPTINADGEHQHEVTGVINWTEYGKWGRLVTTGNYTEYENNHVHPNPTTGSEAAHTHNNPNTETTANHQHTIPATDGPDDTDVAVNGASWGSDCAVGVCVVSFYTHGFAEDSHFHLNTGKKTGWDGSHYHVQAPTLAGSSHTHTMGDTGQQAGLGHRHPISNDTMYQRYMTSVAITADLWVSAEESPHHAHSGAVVPVHGHVVPSDGRVLLKNTNVTIMYLAQEESS